MFGKIKDEVIKMLMDIGVAGEIILTNPPKPEMGNLAFVCFDVAKSLKKSPIEAAKELADKINLKKYSLLEKAVAFGPYVNFYLNTGESSRLVLEEVARKQEKYGQIKTGEGEKVMVEYSQPNTHKEFHIGHFRNVCIGSSVVNIFRRAGSKVVAANYIGDIGAHVAKCLWYIKKFDKKAPKSQQGKWLGQMYAEAGKAADGDPNFKNEIQNVQHELESGNREWIKFWKITKKWSLEEFKKIYKLLGINFDVWFFESEVEKPGKQMVRELLKKGIAKKGDGGAVIVDLGEYGLDIFLILKSDGTSLYSTKDLALAKKKFDRYKIDKSIVVIDSRQSFYFKQLFKTLDLVGWKKDLKCLAYEFVKLPEGAMASRTGNVVLFGDVYNDVFNSALEEVKARHANWRDKDVQKIASRIAIGSMKFDMLKHSIDKVVVFDKKEALSFDGFTGPYILYAIARINSLVKKYKKEKSGHFNSDLLSAPEEMGLVLMIDSYNEILQKAYLEYNPSTIARYCFDLSKQFNDFYNKHRVLGAQSADLVASRIYLCRAVARILTNALSVLGIETVEEM